MGAFTNITTAFNVRQTPAEAYFKGGYAKGFWILNDIFNFTFALFFLIVSAPLFLIIALAIKVRDSGPVFYRGVRLGQHKQPFYMYKFRTLVPDAESILGAQLLSPKHGLETKFGKFLRDTRLDELPQLINILKRDMDFVGPRPERPAIYEKICRHIRHYDKRFIVKPGLIGYSQIFTPHSAPKEIRTFIDNRFVTLKQSFLFDIGLIFYTMFVVLLETLKKSARSIYKKTLFVFFHNFNADKRTAERVMISDAQVHLPRGADEEGAGNQGAMLVDINHEAFLMKSNSPLSVQSGVFELEARFTSRMTRKSKTKRALCYGSVFRVMERPGEDYHYAYVVRFEPVSPLNFYFVHQYFLRESVGL